MTVQKISGNSYQSCQYQKNRPETAEQLNEIVFLRREEEKYTQPYQTNCQQQRADALEHFEITVEG
ncbi:MAG: hypothetical protein IPJ07_01070 [Acidobacteria bacterium]|nr:hypothetical protein [Acidobacteriota bacterium]